MYARFRFIVPAVAEAPLSPGQGEGPRAVVNPPQVSGHLPGDVGLSGAGEADHDHQKLAALAVPLVEEVRLGGEVTVWVGEAGYFREHCTSNFTQRPEEHTGLEFNRYYCFSPLRETESGTRHNCILKYEPTASPIPRHTKPPSHLSFWNQLGPLPGPMLGPSG